MLKKLHLLGLVLGCCVLMSGCDNTTPETSDDVDAEQVKTEAAEAAETAGTYFNQQRESLREKANQTYEQLEDDTQYLMTDLKASGKEAWQNTAAELDRRLTDLQQKYNALKDSGGETLQTSRDAFNVAAEELKDAYQKTKAEFQKNNNSQ
jgi:predicted small secreted protein